MTTAIALLVAGLLLLAYGGWLSYRINRQDSGSPVGVVLYMIGSWVTFVGLFGLSWELAVRGQPWFAWTFGGLLALAGIVVCERSVRR